MNPNFAATPSGEEYLEVATIGISIRPATRYDSRVVGNPEVCAEQRVVQEG
jgi:hypothetical protein